MGRGRQCGSSSPNQRRSHSAAHCDDVSLLIEQAKGILIERHKITEDEAFTMLTHASQRTNTKLRYVAAELVQTGTLRSRG